VGEKSDQENEKNVTTEPYESRGFEKRQKLNPGSVQAEATSLRATVRRKQKKEENEPVALEARTASVGRRDNWERKVY